MNRTGMGFSSKKSIILQLVDNTDLSEFSIIESPLESVSALVVNSMCCVTISVTKGDKLRTAENDGRKLESAAEGQRKHAAVIVEHRQIRLVPRVIVVGRNREPIGEASTD